MTVKELRERLAQYPDDRQVLAFDAEYGLAFNDPNIGVDRYQQVERTAGVYRRDDSGEEFVVIW